MSVFVDSLSISKQNLAARLLLALLLKRKRVILLFWLLDELSTASCWYWNLIYLCDAYELTRHITPGSGTQGYSGDGSAATSASLNNPSGVALDAHTGNLYIADSMNHRIRWLSLSGFSSVVLPV